MANTSSAASLEANSGQKPPSSATPLSRPALGQDPARGAVDLGRPVQRLREAGGTRADDQEVLDVEAAGGMGAAAEDLDLRQRQRDRLATAEMAPERQPARRGGRVRRRHRHRDRGVAAQPPLVGRAVELDQPCVDRGLVGRIQAEQRRPDVSLTLATARVTSRPPNASPPSRRSTRLAGAGRGAGRRDRPAAGTAGQLQLGLDRGPAAAVPDPAAEHRRDASIALTGPAPPPMPRAPRARVSDGRNQEGAGDPAHPLLVGQRGHVLDRRLAVDPGEEQAGQQAAARASSSPRGSQSTCSR